MVTIWSNQLEDRLKDPSQLLKVRGVGWSFGTDKFLLNLNNLPIVYRLWQDLGDFVSVGELARVRHGTDDFTARRDIVNNIMSKLRVKVLPNTDAVISHSGSLSRHFLETGVLYFRLDERSQNVKPARDKPDVEFPDHLKLHFQDWLASKGVQLLIRMRLDSMLGTDDLTKTEAKLLSVLQRFRGYVVPQNTLGQEVYGDLADSDKVREHIRGLRGKGVEIYTARGIGWGLGVTDLNITNYQLMVLNALWRKRRVDFVSISKLCREVYGTDQNLDGIFRLIHEVRLLLGSTRFSIETLVGEERETGYALRFRQSLKPRVLALHFHHPR